MTAPDVAALAAALDSPPYVIDDFEAEAQRIIAALAAQGWRLYSQKAVLRAASHLDDAAVRDTLEELRAEVAARMAKRERAIRRMTKEQRAALDEANHDLMEYVTLYNDTKAALDAALARERRLRAALALALATDVPDLWTQVRAALAETPEAGS